MMKKTETINLAGVVFHIDEDAFGTMKKYLDRLKKAFSKSEIDPNEVMSDIEARIAEILNERLTSAREVVIMSDIEYIIEVIGEPEDLHHEGDNQHARHRAYTNRNYKRLYRDPDNAILGGVCSGLSAHANIDPVIIRIFMIIFIFFGFGVLLYIVLWIVTPMAVTPAQKLEMRGESVTFENIKNFFSREYENVKRSFSKR